MDEFRTDSLSRFRERFGVSRSTTLFLAGLLCVCSVSAAQVFTVEREHVASRVPTNLTTLQPTSVHLSATPITTRTREELIRLFQAEQAFAVRPLPLGKQGLVLHANGPLSPSGRGYTDELEKNGISSKPGDRIVITKFEIERDRIVFEFNGGPEKHHRILRHVSVGMSDQPVVADDGSTPVGSRFSLVFDKYVPEMNAAELRDLIVPILDFSLKTPVQAFADTLPPKLKNAVLNHEVLVGMNRDMVIDAMGQPDQKVRETDDNKVPFEEWIYGAPPHEVQFVRFNGDRVIRLEIADVGQKLVVRDKDETDGYSGGVFVHQVRLGDAAPVTSADSDEARATKAPPTLRQPGEKLPDGADEMKPVQLPSKDAPPEAVPPSSSQAPSPAVLPGQAPPRNPSGSSYPSSSDPIASSPGP